MSTNPKDSLEALAVVQGAMANPADRGLESLFDAFDHVIAQRLWLEARTERGECFECFGAFAIAAAPQGLGIRSSEAADLARHVLLRADHYRAWTEILERIARKRGRPKNIADGDNIGFFSVSRGRHSVDRTLLALKSRHPDLFEDVCNGVCKPYRAAVRAGLVSVEAIALVSPTSQSSGGAWSLETVARLDAASQQKFLKGFFDAMQLDAQRKFIQTVLEPKLGFGLAVRWH